MVLGTVVDVKEERDRLVLEAVSPPGEKPARFRVDIPKDWDVNFGDRVRLEGRHVFWNPAGGCKEFPLPLLRFGRAELEPGEEAP